MQRTGLWLVLLALAAVPGARAAAPYTEATVVLQEDFETNDDKGVWTPYRQETSPNGEGILGRFNQDLATLLIPDLPEHEGVKISFEAYFVGTWDGNDVDDDFTVVLAGQQHGPFTYCHEEASENGPNAQNGPNGQPGPCQTGEASRNTLGYNHPNVGPVDPDTKYVFEYTHETHRGDSVTVTFQDTLDQGELADESWVLDNVEVIVYTKPDESGAVPDFFRTPEALAAMLGTGVMVLGAAFLVSRRRTTVVYRDNPTKTNVGFESGHVPPPPPPVTATTAGRGRSRRRGSHDDESERQVARMTGASNVTALPPPPPPPEIEMPGAAASDARDTGAGIADSLALSAGDRREGGVGGSVDDDEARRLGFYTSGVTMGTVNKLDGADPLSSSAGKSHRKRLSNASRSKHHHRRRNSGSNGSSARASSGGARSSSGKRRSGAKSQRRRSSAASGGSRKRSVGSGSGRKRRAIEEAVREAEDAPTEVPRWSGITGASGYVHPDDR